MSIDTVSLPKNKDDLVLALDGHISREVSNQAPFRVRWLVNHHYIRGIRHFPMLNFTTGEVKYNYVDEKGRFEYRHQKLTSRMDFVKGQMASLDVNPLVKRKGIGIGEVRRRSVAQVILDSIVDPHNLSKVVDDASYIFLACGSVGLSTNLAEHPVIGLGVDFEVVHPQEILPFPSVGTDVSKQRGIIRRRLVELNWLRQKLGAKKISKNMDKLDAWAVSAGENLGVGNKQVSGPTNRSLTGIQPQHPRNTPLALGGSSGNMANLTEVAEIQEVWLFGVLGTVSRYILKCGSAILADENLTDELVYCPLSFERYLSDGTFYGQGLADLLFPLNRESERLSSKLFENVREYERLGVLMLPQGMMDVSGMFKDTGFGLKVGFFEPDPWVQNARPTVINPANMTDFPGKVATFADTMMNDIVPLSSVLFGESPGRVDSASALGFLAEQARRPLTNASASWTRLFGNSYRSITNRATKKLVESNGEIPIAKVNLDLMGIVMRPESGTISFSDNNPLPDPSKLQFSIRDEQPNMLLARKQEAKELVRDQIQSPEELRLLDILEGLDLAIGNPAEKAAAEKTIINVLVIFGDGVTPGESRDNTLLMMPDIQLQIVNAALARPEMMSASSEVRDELLKYKESLMMAQGSQLPMGLGLPEDEALLQQAALDQLGGASAPGGSLA